MARRLFFVRRGFLCKRVSSSGGEGEKIWMWRAALVGSDDGGKGEASFLESLGNWK